ncbi:hypothetical protein HDC30_002395 [Pseudomonas sp. JAI115]|uniref:autotransporter domain-containing protein n=1 Tax=Pseudomonas sp. JAI115 TaxID=2723061 RepID=UPI00161E29BC|nr:autotransporter domain-containing protein [Pseudomonas sp. JAI115]MBB6155172.1 hypothetical protein [Pseudomonas sp. JAI115]
MEGTCNCPGQQLALIPHIKLDYQQMHIHDMQAPYADITFDRIRNTDISAGVNITKSLSLDSGRRAIVFATPGVRQRLASQDSTHYAWRDGAADFSTPNNTCGTAFPAQVVIIGQLMKNLTTTATLDYKSWQKSTTVAGSLTAAYSF